MIFRFYTLDKEITKENAKEIYYSEYFINENTLKFYYENFTEEDFLKWNDEYLNHKLDICESLFNEEKTFETLGEHCHTFSHNYDIFTKNKNTYKRMINYLKKLYTEYGYFINYNWADPYGREFDFGPSEFSWFITIYMGRRFQGDVEKERKYFESHYHYYPEYNWCGLIHVLNMLGFKDLLDELLTDITLPIFKNYKKQKYFGDYEITYNRYSDTYDENDVKGYRDYSLLKKYILEFNIDAPKELKKILEIE